MQIISKSDNTYKYKFRKNLKNTFERSSDGEEAVNKITENVRIKIYLKLIIAFH